MSTRCQIGFYKPDEKDLNKYEALLYRHSDGYPGKLDGSEYGVLPDMVSFLRWFNKNRGLGDTEYVAARLLQHLCNSYDEEMKQFDKPDQPSIYKGLLGYGISNGFHGDIEYFYAVYPDAVKVFEVGFDKPPETWRLIEEISLA